MTYTYMPDAYKLCKEVTWEDALCKINHETFHDTHSLLVSETKEKNKGEVCYVLHNKWYPDTINDAYMEIFQDVGVSIIHVYVSFTDTAPTYPKHNDPCDVLIVQAVGEVAYRFDDGNIVEMKPGDALNIPVGTNHEPIVKQPRITLSCSWQNK